MNLQQAREILELSSSTTPEDAKIKYKKLAKQYHPDVNKAADAEDKFKKINEAYQVISTGKETDRPAPQSYNPFSGFGGMDFNFQQEEQIAAPIQLETTITFLQSVLGHKQDIKYKRQIQCKACNGQGHINLNNGCTTCNGKGRITKQQGNMIIMQTCDKCRGKTNISACTSCSSSGLLETDISINVSIPAGVQNDNVLRLGGMGNYAGSFGPIQQHTDVFLQIKVIPDLDLILIDQDVVSHLSVSLLEAVKGCNKSIKTILGEQEITIPSSSKNKEEIILPNLGVNKQGSQRVILNVEYPENLLTILEK